MGPLGPSVRSRSLLVTGVHGQGWQVVTGLPNLRVSWTSKKFLVVERCGLAAICGVVGDAEFDRCICGAVG